MNPISRNKPIRRKSELLTPAAFSLVELLIVIAIAGVLAALIFPVFGKAKSSANAAICAANLRQIGTGILASVGENDGKLPPEPALSLNGFLMDALAGTYETSGTHSTTSYGAKVARGPIVKSWICPGDPTRGGWQRFGAPNGVPGNNDAETGVNAHSYSANRLVLNRKLGEIPRPGQSILMTDFQWFVPGTRLIWPDISPWKDNIPTTWHKGGFVNCLFVDGHVESLSAKTLVWGQSNTRLWYSDYPESKQERK